MHFLIETICDFEWYSCDLFQITEEWRMGFLFINLQIFFEYRYLVALNVAATIQQERLQER